MPDLSANRPHLGGHYVLAVTPADVGARVSLRRRLAAPPADGREVYGDVLGDLLAWTGGELLVRTRDGAEVRIEEATLVAGKKIPPPPPPRRARS